MRWIVLACVLVSGGCAQPGTASDNLGPIQIADFRCPKPGTLVTFSTGSVTRYTGTEPGNPLLCKGVFGDQNPLQRVFNYWNASPSVLADVMPAMAQLFPAEKNKTAHFVFYGSPIGSANLSQRYLENWRVLGGEQVRLGSRSVHTIVFERETAGTDGSNMSLMRYKLWLAPELGVWLRSDAVSVRGTTIPQSFLVADVFSP